jgi:NTE family protein
MKEPAELSDRGDLAIVLTGGGARAAYQVGVLRGIAKRYPQTKFDIITGVSAGAINALFLASRHTPLAKTVDDLTELWRNLRLDDVICVDALSLLRHMLVWSFRLLSGGAKIGPRIRGLVGTSPLRSLLLRTLPPNEDGAIAGVAGNISRCTPKAVALTTLNYNTGQTVTWVDGCAIETWERPLRRSVRTKLTVDHVMASAALPIAFPAVRLGKSWHGDGGIRLAAPFSPALHLGARRILAISTSYAKSFAEAELPETVGYPPPAQILGQLMDAVFLDVVDEDALRLERSNTFLRELPPDQRRGYRVVDLLVIRPSQDLGALAGTYEPLLPRAFRFLTRGLGTKETSSPDFLSLLMFQPEYLQKLIEIGEQDAEARMNEIGAILAAGDSATDEPWEPASAGLDRAVN